MQSKQTYKNSLKSKRLIKEAFLFLLSDKDISKIRVREIIEIADISRGTFYSHYQDIYAVLEEIENENIDILVESISFYSPSSLINDFTPFINELFLSINSNKDIYINLFKSNVAPMFLSKLQQVFINHMLNDESVILNFNSKKEANIFFSFIAVGTASLIYEYVLSSNNDDLDSLVCTLNNSILHGISHFIK